MANPFYQAYRRMNHTRHNLTGIMQLVYDPTLSRSYYPDEKRKPKWAIWMDNLLWLVRSGEVNKYYYVYGFDKKNTADLPEVLPYKEFIKIRNSRNLHPNQQGYNYVCILRDKFVFSQFLTSLGIPTPVNVALLKPDEVTWIADMKKAPLTSLLQDPNINLNGFCKELGGILGKGAFPLRIENQKLYVKDEEITVDQLKEKLTGQFLLQERLQQHPKMSELHPSSVNTIRLITFNNNGKVEVFCASLRIGTKGRSVDNWASGGIVVAIDTATGKLKGEGLFKPGYGGRVTAHPDTGVTLDGFEIPYFKEGIEVACNLHSYLYGIHSVGWDIAITPDGPTIIEGNDDWEGGIPMSLEKNFRSRFLQFFRN